MSETRTFPPQKQSTQPGSEALMTPRPRSENDSRRGSGRLDGKVALISGGDSGIGRAVALAFAKEGADVAITFLNEERDAQETVQGIEKQSRRALAVAGDIGRRETAQQVVAEVMAKFGRLDIVINNAAEQHPVDDIALITEENLERTFRTNIFGYFFLVQAALPHLQEGAAIINTTSVTAYAGSPQLIDYSSTKGAIVAFTRSLSLSLADRKIRVNAVAPGPIWTPLIPATFPEEKVETFGADTPMKRAGQPEEVAPAYVFLASSDASYMSGQVLHVNGGRVVNG